MNLKIALVESGCDKMQHKILNTPTYKSYHTPKFFNDQKTQQPSISESIFRQMSRMNEKL